MFLTIMMSVIVPLLTNTHTHTHTHTHTKNTHTHTNNLSESTTNMWFENFLYCSHNNTIEKQINQKPNENALSIVPH